MQIANMQAATVLIAALSLMFAAISLSGSQYIDARHFDDIQVQPSFSVFISPWQLLSLGKYRVTMYERCKHAASETSSPTNFPTPNPTSAPTTSPTPAPSSDQNGNRRQLNSNGYYLCADILQQSDGQIKEMYQNFRQQQAMVTFLFFALFGTIAALLSSVLSFIPININHPKVDLVKAKCLQLLPCFFVVAAFFAFISFILTATLPYFKLAQYYALVHQRGEAREDNIRLGSSFACTVLLFLTSLCGIFTAYFASRDANSDTKRNLSQANGTSEQPQTSTTEHIELEGNQDNTEVLRQDIV